MTSSNSPFEEIKRSDEDGAEFWSSRELAQVLDYSDYRNFGTVIEKAKTACKNSDAAVGDHFVDVTEMVVIGSGARRLIKTTLLSRYACYLIIQNADPTKENVALGQTYFAIQTRRQELADQALDEATRVKMRKELSDHQKNLFATAKKAGVKDPIEFAIFQNSGYRGLYGMARSDIQKYKGLKPGQEVLDYAGTAELAANLFRATQAEQRLRREGIKDKIAANRVHFNAGRRVRQAMADIGGVMPEDLPVEEDIKKVERRLNKELGDGKLN